MARLEIRAPNDERIFEILDEFLTIGGAAGNHLRLGDPEVAPVHLRLIRGQDGYRMEIADAGLAVAVNGEPCTRHLLADHDQIEIGDTVLTFLDAAAGEAEDEEPVPIPVHHRRDHGHREQRGGHGSHGAHAAHGTHGKHGTHGAHAEHGAHGEHGHHHYHPVKKSPVGLWVGCAIGAAAVVFVLMQVVGAGSYYRQEGSPEHWLEQAKAEVASGALSRALDSCQVAELRGPGADTMQQIQELRAQIKQRMGKSDDAAALDYARQGLEAMQQFETQYLATSRPRPAVRDLARTAQAWLQRYTDVLRRYPERAPDVAKVQAIAQRYVAEAQLEKPDDAADVLFAVDRRLALPQPLYNEALLALDDYVRNHENDARLTDLKVRRVDVVAKARADFDGHEAAARRLLGERRFTDALKEIQEMRNSIVLPVWQKTADALEAEIQRAAK